MPRNLNTRQRQQYARLLNTPPRLPPEMPTVQGERLRIVLFAAVAAGAVAAFVYACVVGVP